MITELQKKHVAGWNEKDADKRLQILGEVYAADIQMHDKDFSLKGIQEVSDFIGKLLADDPNFTFSASKDIEFAQNGARLSGKIVTGVKPDIFESMDFFVIKNDKVAELFVYMDLVS